MSAYYNDIDPYCCRVLRKNIALGNLPGGYVDERDIRDVRASDLVGYQHIHLFAGIGGFPLGLRWAGFPESIKVLTGGFPCQDISVAGKKAGITGRRSGLWTEFHRIICELRPRYILVENVSALLDRGMGTVLADLAQSGYDAEWQVLPATAFGAPHLRERCFIIAYPGGERYHYASLFSRNHEIHYDAQWHTTQNIKSWQGWKRWFRTLFHVHDWAESTSPLLGMADGIPNRMDRIRGLGNSIVPQIAEYVARCIMAALEREGVA